jgi:hypothetical protein
MKSPFVNRTPTPKPVILVNGKRSATAIPGDVLSFTGDGPVSEWGTNLVIEADGVATVNVTPLELRSGNTISCPAFTVDILGRFGVGVNSVISNRLKRG